MAGAGLIVQVAQAKTADNTGAIVVTAPTDVGATDDAEYYLTFTVTGGTKWEIYGQNGMIVPANGTSVPLPWPVRRKDLAGVILFSSAGSTGFICIARVATR